MEVTGRVRLVRKYEHGWVSPLMVALLARRFAPHLGSPIVRHFTINNSPDRRSIVMNTNDLFLALAGIKP